MITLKGLFLKDFLTLETQCKTSRVSCYCECIIGSEYFTCMHNLLKRNNIFCCYKNPLLVYVVTCYKFHIMVISQYFLHSIVRPERRHFSIKKEEYRTSLEKSITTLSVINSYVCIQLCYQLMSTINASLWEHYLSQCINDLMHYYTPLSIADQLIYPNRLL